MHDNEWQCHINQLYIHVCIQSTDKYLLFFLCFFLCLCSLFLFLCLGGFRLLPPLPPSSNIRSYANELSSSMSSVKWVGLYGLSSSLFVSITGSFSFIVGNLELVEWAWSGSLSLIYTKQVWSQIQYNTAQLSSIELENNPINIHVHIHVHTCTSISSTTGAGLWNKVLV